jgi:hypothetical protein
LATTIARAECDMFFFLRQHKKYCIRNQSPLTWILKRCNSVNALESFTLPWMWSNVCPSRWRRRAGACVTSGGIEVLLNTACILPDLYYVVLVAVWNNNVCLLLHFM